MRITLFAIMLVLSAQIASAEETCKSDSYGYFFYDNVGEYELFDLSKARLVQFKMLSVFGGEGSEAATLMSYDNNNGLKTKNLKSNQSFVVEAKKAIIKVDYAGGLSGMASGCWRFIQ